MRTVSRIWKRRRIVLPLLAIGLFSAGIKRGFAADGAEGRIAEHVTLTNGFELICDHREQTGDRVRLYTEADNSNFVEVGAADVASVDTIVLPAPAIPASATSKLNPGTHADLTKAELHELLSSAGAQHNLDVNLLASVVRAESGGHTAAVSKKGAQGLMQLMPKTASQLGVGDSLRPDENVAGGASYLDLLLTRYHDNLALALAAYNAGPAAVDRWHGVPPCRETRLYVARIIRDFNASVRNANSDAAKLTRPVHLLPNTVMQPDHEQAGLTGATAP
jgi:Transglycosylase SLT domain